VADAPSALPALSPLVPRVAIVGTAVAVTSGVSPRSVARVVPLVIIIGPHGAVVWGQVVVTDAASALPAPVDPSFRALSGRLKFTVRRHKFNKDSLLQVFVTDAPSALPALSAQFLTVQVFVNGACVCSERCRCL